MLGFTTVGNGGPLPVSGSCLGPGWTWCGSEQGSRPDGPLSLSYVGAGALRSACRNTTAQSRVNGTPS